MRSKVPVSRDKNQVLLETKRRYPVIIIRNGSARASELNKSRAYCSSISQLDPPLGCQYLVKTRVMRPLAHQIGKIGSLRMSNRRGRQLIEDDLIQALLTLRRSTAKRMVDLKRNAPNGVLDFSRLFFHACMLADFAGTKVQPFKLETLSSPRPQGD